MINLSAEIKKQLPAELVELVQTAGEVAAGMGTGLYLVGGAVRDLLLGRTNLDLDLVVEGNAIDLAQKLLRVKPGRITTHPRFNTAKVQHGRWNIDLATARSETYAKPGALPTVKPGSLSDDLFRRDFTVNAMAVNLNPVSYGELIDPCGGRDDLKSRLVRVLHDGSFIDDATRIWRGLRYEQRLDFRLEPDTLKLLKRDAPMLATISGDRLRHELELALKEDYPEKVLLRAQELGVLRWLHPSLEGDGWLRRKFEQARVLTSPSVGLYLALLAWRLSARDCDEFTARLRFTKTLARTLRDTAVIKAGLEPLADAGLAPSRIYKLLHGYAPTAINASLAASDSPIAQRNIKLYLDKLRYVKLALTGDDLKKMGIAAGPRIKEILDLLLEARLDGRVKDRQGGRRW